ncbi:MAG: SHOCT domain-containing protein [Bacilli bacterium]|nr:SHOCT domain-containing protein [Bacilli bacterium]
MKIVALVFTILGMIATLITSTYNFCVYLYANYVTMAILSLVLGVLSVLFGIFAISDLNKNRKRIWVGVSSLIFCGLVGGILYLCWQPEVAPVNNNKDGYYTPTDYDAPTAPINNDKEDVSEILLKLNRLYEEGIISKEEYEEKRKKYVDKL